MPCLMGVALLSFQQIRFDLSIHFRLTGSEQIRLWLGLKLQRQPPVNARQMMIHDAPQEKRFAHQSILCILIRQFQPL